VLTVENLVKTYQTGQGSVMASRGLGFALERGEVVSLVGPSGCGKTTALRSVAGLEIPDSGRIAIGDKVLFDSDARIEMPVHRRPIGMVFQSYAIWPHMTVFENVAYPLRVQGRRKFGKDDIRERVMRALERVRIPELASRRATMLSGGQQQRVAIARALVRDAEVLLFDEPLSNLDAKLREEMRGELRELFQETGVAVLYVTHDLGEALALSDRLFVLEAGQIVQVGSPEDIYGRPCSEFVARFLGNVALVPGEVRARIGELAVIDSVMGECLVEGDAPAGSKITLLVRPEGVRLRSSSLAGVSAHVDAVLYLGGAIEYRLRLADGLRFVARISPHEERFITGDEVTVELERTGLSIITEPSASVVTSADSDALVGVA
jgi:ABC-type Fe3+/spermidine/putrescine transport system ATPase subunit